MKRIRHFIRKLLIFSPALFLFAAVLTVVAEKPEAAAQIERKKITVGYSEVTGLSETGADGEPHGLIIDYLNEISKYTDWDYEYVKTDNLLDDFEEGKYDLIGGNYYLPQLEEFCAYPKYSIGNSRSALFCRKDDGDIKGYELTSLNGKTIGVYERAEENIRRLKEFLKSNNIDCTLKYYSYEVLQEQDTLYGFLERGEVDLILGNATESEHNFRLATTFTGQPYYIVAHVDAPEMVDSINMALEYILDSNPQFHDNHYTANFPTWVSSILLTQKELNYIQEKQSVSVAVVKNMHPFFCIDNPEDHHSGVIPDLLDSISDFSGLSFTYVYVDTYADSLRLLQSGEVDMMGAYLDSETVNTSDSFVLSNSYATLNNILVKNKTIDYPNDNVTIGIQEGRSLPSNIVGGSIRYFPTVAAGLEAANNGEIDIYYGLSTSMERELQRHRFLNIIPIALVNHSTSISFALNRPADTDLLSIINKSLISMSEEELNSLTNRNLISMGYSSLSISELIYSNPMAFVTIFSAFLLLLVMIFLLYQRSRIKSTLMQSEMKKTEAKTKAKSAFLSRMSHEIRTPMNAIVGLANLTCMEKDLPAEAEQNLKKLLASSQYLLSLINDILDMSRIESDKLEILPDSFSLQQLVEDLDGMMRLQAQQKQIILTKHCRIDHPYLLGDAVRLRQVLINLLSNAIKFTPAGGRVCLQIEELSSTQDTAEYLFSVADTGIGIEPEYQTQIFDSFEQLGASDSKSAGTGLGLPISRSIVEAMGGTLDLNSTPGENSEFYFRLVFPLVSLEDFQNTVPAASADLDGSRILVAEDNDLNAEITQELLATLGAETERAADGQEAVDKFNASSFGYYSLILMDIRMPNKDGLQACREIRSGSHPQASNIPIIALTANSFKEDSDAAKAAGMNGFISKPIDIDYMKQVLGKIMQRR